MKKLYVFFLIMSLMGCSSNRATDPSHLPEHTQTQSVSPSKTLVTSPNNTQESSPQPTATETVEPIATSIPPATPTQSEYALSPDNIKEIKLLKQWGKGTPEVTAWSPDGKLFLVGTSLGVYVLNAQTTDEIRFIKTGQAIRELAISPDSKVLATNSDSLMLWDLGTGTLLKKMSAHERGFFGSLSFSPGGTWLAALENTNDGGDTTLFVWRTSGWDLQYSKQLGGCGYTFSLAFSPDGRTIAIHVCEHLSLYRTLTGERITSFDNEITSRNIAFTKDGKGILAGTTTNRIRLIDVETQEILKVFKTDGTNSILLSPNHERMAVVGIWNDERSNYITEIWNIETEQLESIIDTGYKGVSFSADGGQLTSINKTENLDFWDIETGTLERTFSWTSTVESISFGAYKPDENTMIDSLLAANKAGQVNVINADTKGLLQTIDVSTSPVSSVALHPNGYILAAGVADDKVASIILYDLRAGQVLREIKIIDQTYQVEVWGLAFSLDGWAIAAKTNTFYEIQAWDISSGKHLSDPGEIIWFNASTIGGDAKGHLIDLEFISPDGGYTGTYQINDMYTGDVLASSLSVDETGICQELENYSLSNDDRYFALGCDLFTLPVWDLKEQILSHNLKDHIPWVGDGGMGNITDVIFSPYGYLFASSGYDDTIRFWNAESGENLETISAHSCRVTDIAFSIDGKYLASTSCDGTLRLWGLQR